ncbi:helix-turn-helix domain-containing protein [Paraburkholderia phenoliruptrix]|uniref:helix-turn-helix domain-containing protein n=1 Tax=Paraburkholderia phenoliruptrix TaxID=252970 RepID=UPI002869E5D2|nr:helix-turn-helix transcriptional regulator [Paraburkholderia phenoliruptrix]WMY09080.1 helix-turn-helix transcriptional regulator [Paraburkholderia phenoliruptrix]
MSQEVLADRAGLHRTHVSQIERGNANVALDTIVALAMALGVSEAQLLTEQDEQPIPLKSGRKKALANSAVKLPRAKT